LIIFRCPVVQHVILEAYKKGLNFQVCILDSTITRRGITLLYFFDQTLFILCNLYYKFQCQLILLGCSAVFSDGSIMAELGAGILAMHGAFDNIPVIVVAQSYKFVDKVRKILIPAERITAIITEIRSLPPTSVPAVLKAKQLVVT
uniref:Translation initiation factor eIF2B subunit delta n=1 Tax=Dracunculus medinensis TaxID=318479 RepID=A0A0N4UKJ3_DRAME